MPGSKIKVWIFALLNGACMLILALYWLSLPRTFGDELIFTKWTSIVKKSLLGFDERPAPDEVLYVDVSGSKMLLELDDPLYEEPTGFHRTAITDREQLAAFLNMVALYGSDIPLVLMDISFELPDASDTELQSVIDSFPFPILAARRLGYDGELMPSVIELPTGVANYLSTDYSFMKYPLFLKDTMPSLPLVAWSMTEGKAFSNTRLWPRMDGRRSLHKPIIDFKIRPFHLNWKASQDTTGYTLRAMGTLLFEWDFWAEEDIRKLLQNKTIIIGDYYFDRHQTIFGILPGPLIVHNAYLTLKSDESLIPWSWLLLLYLLFVWISLRSVKEVMERELGGPRKWKTIIGDLLADSIDETLFLIVATVLSYFIFNIHINVLVVLVFLKVTSYIFGRFVFRASIKPAETVLAPSPESTLHFDAPLQEEGPESDTSTEIPPNS